MTEGELPVYENLIKKGMEYKMKNKIKRNIENNLEDEN
jgi:hypothetical protein